MELFSGIFIICALVTQALTLKCFKCESSTGNCTQQKVCDPALNLQCTTMLITSRIGVRTARQIIKDCGNCFVPTSLNTGILAQFTGSSCCNSDLCNDPSHEVKENMTLNGLECDGCHSDSSAACANSTSIVKCVGIQNRCSHNYIPLSSSGEHIVFKGCVSESICEYHKSSSFGVQTSPDIHSCKESLCNKDTAFTGQLCHSCIGEPGGCQSRIMQCISSSCRTVSIKEVNNGTSQEHFVKGCGNCTENVSLNTGTFKVERVEECCQSHLCNNRTIAVKANTTLNGLECYGCAPLSNNMCEDWKERVKCVGKQSWCLHLSATATSLQNVTLKGCASESICKNPDLLKIHHLRPEQDFYCCNGSGCNRGSVPSGRSTAQTTTPANTVTANNYSSTLPVNMINAVLANNSLSVEMSSANTTYNLTVSNHNSMEQTSPVNSSDPVTLANNSPKPQTAVVQPADTVTLNSHSPAPQTAAVQPADTVTLNSHSPAIRCLPLLPLITLVACLF
ncbi:uncharacterized protein [Scyliorhinus torazame]|uniref:UPAR/Ly6 domain-containing protein n=1 Tax=Scyliorhinus torazame TaxID=75743 RepID=A0A401Q2C1_SCYTO|nr:hypothetical protein [Scyliorhinus torazame]